MTDNIPQAVNNENMKSDETIDAAFDSPNGIKFFPVSEGKLMTLYILSFGLYAIYWFYRNWQLQQADMDKKIMPFWRAIFSIFFTHSLFRRIDAQATHIESKHRFNANILATVFVAAVVVGKILDNLTSFSDNMFTTSHAGIFVLSLAIFLLSTYPLVKVQATVNRINDDILGFLNHKYSVWNYLLIIAGTITWLLLAMGLLNWLAAA